MSKYRVEAVVCDTIRSVPVEKTQAEKLKKATKMKIPHAQVKLKKV
jgi:hypothetical protein